ncbi:hypothetical protein D1BOALGB6SA_2239 [Olavius sp. associated proteobacterium Delta 1]|nr:hypothetical protein D1BOALGB6SA_2239 [Olavius sp. associated proteobacterium Delta 1]
MEKVKTIQWEMNRQLWFWFQTLGGVAVYFLILGQFPAAAKQSPTIRLFPTTVVENIKQTGQAAKAMEQDLQSVIDRLNQQEELYIASKCEGAGAEQGCSEIAGQLSQTYLEMLNLMETRLPGMEDSVRVTNASLEKRIRKELGRKTTPRGLQKVLEKTPQKATDSPRYTRRAGRLSEKFRQYYKLVAMAPKMGSGGSLASVAAEIYLDTQQVQELIALTRDEISRAKLMIDLDQAYGIITPEMFEMVGRVKSILFGQAGEEEGIPGPPPGSTKAEYRSPLEM